MGHPAWSPDNNDDISIVRQTVFAVYLTLTRPIFSSANRKNITQKLSLPPFVNLDIHQTSPPIPPYKQTNSPSSQRNHHGTQPPRKQAPSTSFHSRPRPIIPINYLPKQHKPSQHKHREKESPTCVAGTPFAAARNRSSTGIVPAAHARV